MRLLYPENVEASYNLRYDIREKADSILQTKYPGCSFGIGKKGNRSSFYRIEDIYKEHVRVAGHTPWSLGLTDKGVLRCSLSQRDDDSLVVTEYVMEIIVRNYLDSSFSSGRTL